MYVFEYHDQTYYINVENITSMVVGPYVPYMGAGEYSHYIPEPNDQWTLIIKSGSAHEKFILTPKKLALTLAGEICDMHSAMFDARVGK